MEVCVCVGGGGGGGGKGGGGFVGNNSVCTWYSMNYNL